MPIQNPPSALGKLGAKPAASAARPQQQTASRDRDDRKQPRSLDDFEYGEEGPQKIYQHLGTHIMRVTKVEEGDADDTGDHYFSATGVIVDSDNPELSPGAPARHGKTLFKKIPRYFFKHQAELTSAIFQSLGEDIRPGDVKTPHVRILTGGEYTDPESGEVVNAEPFDFEANEAVLRFVVKSEEKKDRDGRRTGEFQNNVYVYGVKADQ